MWCYRTISLYILGASLNISWLALPFCNNYSYLRSPFPHHLLHSLQLQRYLFFLYRHLSALCC